MLEKGAWLCWLDMFGSVGENPNEAGRQMLEGGLHPVLLPLLEGFLLQWDDGK